MGSIHPVNLKKAAPDRTRDWTLACYVFGFMLIIGALEVSHLMWFVNTATFAAYLDICTNAAVLALNLVGVEATARGDLLSGPSGPIRIGVGCEGLQPVYLLIATTLPFPRARWAQRIIGAMAGALALLLLNIGRIAALVLIVGWDAEAFDLMHTTVLPMALMFASVLWWIVWMQWAVRAQAAT